MSKENNTSFVKEDVVCHLKDRESEKAALTKTEVVPCQSCLFFSTPTGLVGPEGRAVALTMYNNNAFKAGTSLVLAGFIATLLVRCK